VQRLAGPRDPLGAGVAREQIACWVPEQNALAISSADTVLAPGGRHAVERQRDVGAHRLHWR
jgi:hypothetical protein